MEPSIEDLTSIDHRAFSKSNEFTPLNPDKANDGGFKVIAGCFAVLTGVISVALVVHLYQRDNQVGEHGSVVSDNKECSNIGESLFKDGGNAVDVAIGVTFCMGVVHPHLTGIGGNGVMLIYNHKLGKVTDCINFNGRRSSSEVVGIPGLIKGLFEAHSNFGKLTWKHVLSYSVQLARTGFTVTESLKSSMRYLRAENTHNDLGLWLSSLSLGETSMSQSLANTLQTLSEQGGNEFYNGFFTHNLAHILSSDDMKNYKAENNLCIEEEWNSFKLFTTGQGTGGPLLTNVLQKYKQENDSDHFTTFSTINAVMKSQEKYMNGVVINSVDKEDTYVSIISGLGSVLGSQILTPEGFILNDATAYGTRKMFSNELSTLSLPLVLTESKVCSSRYITGASDFRDLLQLLLMIESQFDLQTAVENPRVRILGKSILVEDEHAPSFPSDQLQRFKDAGFDLGPAQKPYPSINIIRKFKDVLSPYADSRGLGLAINL